MQLIAMGCHGGKGSNGLDLVKFVNGKSSLLVNMIRM